MNCSNCNAPLGIDQRDRKIKYCSEECRSIIYYDKIKRNDIREALRIDNWKSIGHIKLSTLRRLGFDIIIKEKEISTL